MISDVSSVETDTYLYYIKLAERVSLPSQNVLNAWDERMEQQALSDFNTLMRNTTFLEDMRIEVNDFTFPNGAVGKITGKQGLRFEGPARVFDCEEDMLAGL